MSKAPIIFALASAALFGLSTPAGKALLASVQPAVLAGLFYCGAGVGMTLLRRIRRRRGSQATEVALGSRDMPWLAAAVFSGGVVGPLLLMIGLAQTADRRDQGTRCRSYGRLGNFLRMLRSNRAIGIDLDMTSSCSMRCKIFIAAIVIALSAAARAEPATNPRLVLVCAPCHGFDGIAHDATIPNLAGQSREYLRRQLLMFRSGERKHPTMNFFSGQVDQDELDQLVDYYASKTRQ